MPGSIFISYRRQDASWQAGRLYDSLVAEFGRGAVYKDIDSIPLSADYREHIDKGVEGCDVFLALISKAWASRLHETRDFVRIEIESALTRAIPIIPVFLSGEEMPNEDDLPASIRELAFRHGQVLRAGADYSADIQRIIGFVRELDPTVARARREAAEREAAEREAAEREAAEREAAQDIDRDPPTPKAWRDFANLYPIGSRVHGEVSRTSDEEIAIEPIDGIEVVVAIANLTRNRSYSVGDPLTIQIAQIDGRKHEMMGFEVAQTIGADVEPSPGPSPTSSETEDPAVPIVAWVAAVLLIIVVWIAANPETADPVDVEIADVEPDEYPSDGMEEGMGDELMSNDQMEELVDAGDEMEDAADGVERTMSGGPQVTSNAEETYQLGLKHLRGRDGYERSGRAALPYFTRAGAVGHLAALSDAAHLLTGRGGVTANYAQALQYARRSATAGHHPAQVILAGMHEQGWGTRARPDSALYWYRRARDRGNTSARSAYLQLSRPAAFFRSALDDPTAGESAYAYFTQTNGTGPVVGKGVEVEQRATFYTSDLQFIGRSTGRIATCSSATCEIIDPGRLGRIGGWSENLENMKEGERRLLWIHPSRVQNSGGATGLPSGSVLVVDLTVVRIVGSDAVVD